MKRESFGSGWVKSGERRSLPDDQTIAPFTVHFVLPAELLEQAVLLLDKLSKKKLRCRVQESKTYIFSSQ